MIPSTSTVVIVGAIYGGSIGLITCMVVAYLAKPYNLGLFWNAVTGIAIGSGTAVAAVLFGASLVILGFAVIAVPAAVMLVFGAHLNHRAR